MKKRIAIVTLLVSVILLGIYFFGAFYYKDKFPNKVYINEVNVGGMTLEEADRELAKTDLWNKVIIKSDTEEFVDIKVEEIDYKYIGTPELPKILKEQNEWKWPLDILKKSTYDTVISSDYNKDRIKEIIDDMGIVDTEPLNAKVAYSDSSDEFIIEPHGIAINITKDQMFDLVAETIDRRNSEVNVEENIEQPTIFEDDESLDLAKDKANEYLDIELKYDFEDREELIDGSIIKDWVTIDGEQVDISPEKVKEYVVELAKKYDTFGVGRPFKTNTGDTITTSGGSYGWVTHRGKTTDELVKHVKDGEDKTIKPVYSYEALIRKTDDIGNSYVEIDLNQQMVFVYVEGELKVQTPTVTGNISKGYSTQAGVYPLNYKETDAVLRGDNYASPVKYWMPFNGDIGLHDADWRNSFGGNIYQSDGSHGCVNLPPANAKAIFDLVYPGMPVIVH